VPHNDHAPPTQAEITAALADHAPASPVSASALQEHIAAEIVTLTGCDQPTAMIGAGAFLTMHDAPHYGLRDGTPEGAHAAYHLGQWIAAKVVAYRAGQDRKAA
jgi:hypothetical protein